MLPPSASLWKRNLFMLWFSQLLVMAGFSAMIPFIPLFIKGELGIAEEGKLAIYVSMFNFFGTMAYAIFCPIWGVLADRFGVKPMLLRGTFVTAFLFPLMGYVHHAETLILLRFLTAACAGTTAASQTMIARTTPDDKQGFAQGVLTTAIWGGAMLGNVIGGMIIHYYSYLHAFWFCGILYFLAGFAVVLTRDDFIPKQKKEKTDAHQVHLHKAYIPAFTYAVWLMLALFLLMGIFRNFESPYIALKVEALSSSEMASWWTGIISAVVCAGAILSGVVSGYFSDKVSPEKMLIPIFLISALALFLQGWTSSLLVLTISRTLLYIAAGGVQPVLQKLLSGITPKRKRGSVFGFSSCASNIGSMLAAVFSGWSVFLFRLNGVFYTAAIITLICLPVFLNFISAIKTDRYYRHTV